MQPSRVAGGRRTSQTCGVKGDEEGREMEGGRVVEGGKERDKGGEDEGG